MGREADAGGAGVQQCCLFIRCYERLDEWGHAPPVEGQVGATGCKQQGMES